MSAIKALFVGTIISVSACSNDLPDIDRTISMAAQTQQPPKLLPLDQFLDTAIIDSQKIEADRDALQARLLMLRRKAAALRGQDIYDGQDALRRLQP